MNVPWPHALLVEHAALPLPMQGAHGLTFERLPAIREARLSRADRLTLASQLLAATELLAEFELWPGSSALHSSGFEKTDAGPRARLAGFPRPLDVVLRRLGGGSAAGELLRERAIAAVERGVGLAEGMLAGESSGAGLHLGNALNQVLHSSSLPLDPTTASALWAVRYEGLTEPGVGELNYWKVQNPTAARRLGAALFARIRSAGRKAWMQLAQGDETSDTGPIPLVGEKGTLVVCGSISKDDLAVADRWSREPGCSAVVVGEFPPGWAPPAPTFFDGGSISRTLAVAGRSPDRCRRFVDELKRHFNPFEPADIRALTDRAMWRWDRGPDVDEDREEARLPERVLRVLSLRRDGVPESLVMLASEARLESIRERALRRGVVIAKGKWRLEPPQPLQRDELHRDVAELFPTGDPNRLLHLALAGEGTDELLDWAWQRIAELDPEEVIDLIDAKTAAELGAAALEVLAVACLCQLDVGGARLALSLLPDSRKAILSGWLQVVDPPEGIWPEVPSLDDARRSPRACGEIGLRLLRRAEKQGKPEARQCRMLIEFCMERLTELERIWLGIDFSSIVEPAKVEDGDWRRSVSATHPKLKLRVHHRRALDLSYGGRLREAARILRVLIRQESVPGRLGMLELDLGCIEQDLDHDGEAARCYHRAFHLLQAAGFTHKTRNVLFNLASYDIDRFDLERAAEKLRRSSSGSDDFFVIAEKARLALARGNLREFRTRVMTLPQLVPGADPRLDEGFSFLRGVGALLDGEPRRARPFLEEEGDEGLAWLDLADALEGRSTARQAAIDAWGVTVAADLLRGEHSELLVGESRAERIQDGFAIALADRVSGPIVGLSQARRNLLAQQLEEQGLTGWAARLRRREEQGSGAYEELLALVESGSPSSLEDRQTADLLAALGVGGLEIRNRETGETVWRVGTGEEAESVQRGRLELIPLGGPQGNGELMALLGALMDLVLPAQVGGYDSDTEGTGLLGQSAAMQKLRSEIQQFAESRVSVSFFGETGVGKDVAARALHKLSGRRGRFVPVNVAAIPAGLLEAELFGSVKGAFTGADRSRTGLAVAADEGTLFLDEIGDLDLQLQVKLLRFLESHMVRPVGSESARKVNVRIVAATHQNLTQKMAEGSFRQDLYYRLATAPIEIPPLRQRREDIPELRDHFQTEAVRRDGLQTCNWSEEASRALRKYDWPGNVRELKHVVEVAMVRSKGGVVYPRHLPLPEFRDASVPVGTWDESLDAFRRQLIRRALEQTDDNRSAAARTLGISRQTLNYHMRNLGIGEKHQKR